jgi:hypothetical protein
MRAKYSQSITYWPKSGQNDFGEETFGSPILLSARWEDRNEQVRLPSGEEIVSKSVVFIPQATAVTIGSRLAKGDHTAVVNPEEAWAREIQAILEVPSLRTNQVERRVIL